jgi:hypothetical protein
MISVIPRLVRTPSEMNHTMVEWQCLSQGNPQVGIFVGGTLKNSNVRSSVDQSHRRSSPFDPPVLHVSRHWMYVTRP